MGSGSAPKRRQERKIGGMSEQAQTAQTKEARDERIRAMVIAWLREAFETGDYRLLNRGGATPSKDYYIQIRNRTEADLRELRMKVEIYKDGVLADTVTAKTGASGIAAGESGSWPSSRRRPSSVPEGSAGHGGL